MLNHHQKDCNNFTSVFFPCMKWSLFRYHNQHFCKVKSFAGFFLALQHRGIKSDSSQPGHTLVNWPPFYLGGQRRHAKSLLLRGVYKIFRSLWIKSVLLMYLLKKSMVQILWQSLFKMPLWFVPNRHYQFFGCTQCDCIPFVDAKSHTWSGVSHTLCQLLNKLLRGVAFICARW